MKPALLLLGSVLASFSASAAFVDFADPGTPVSLQAYIYTDGDLANNYITGTNPGILADGDRVHFAGNLHGIPQITVWLDIYDDGFANSIPGLIAQASLTIFNSTGSILDIPANSLQIGVSGLYALGGAQLAPDFNFNYISLDGVDLASRYDPLTGNFYFTNLSDLSIPNSNSLVANGTFNTIPEPGTITLAVLGIVALSFAARCRSRLIPRHRCIIRV